MKKNSIKFLVVAFVGAVGALMVEAKPIQVMSGIIYFAAYFIIKTLEERLD